MLYFDSPPAIKLPAMLLHKGICQSMLLCRCKATELICCLAQLSIAGIKKLVIMQRSFSCKNEVPV